MDTPQKRFADLSEEDLAQILDQKDSKRTKDVIKMSVKLLTDFANEKGLCINDVNQQSLDELQLFLRRFYAELRKTNGDYYSKKSLITVRYGLQKHFQKSKDIDIVNDAAFANANSMFHAMLTKLKSIGKGDTQHYEPLTNDVLKKLYASFDTSTTTGLLEKVSI